MWTEAVARQHVVGRPTDAAGKKKSRIMSRFDIELLRLVVVFV